MCGGCALEALERLKHSIRSAKNVREYLGYGNKAYVFQLDARRAGFGSRFEMASRICINTAEILDGQNIRKVIAYLSIYEPVTRKPACAHDQNGVIFQMKPLLTITC